MQPLADKLRPKELEDMVGQSHIIGKGKIINKLLDNNTIPNMILYISNCLYTKLKENIQYLYNIVIYRG